MGVFFNLERIMIPNSNDKKNVLLFHVVRSRLVQFSHDHILFQVPIGGKKITQWIAVHTER